MTEWHWETLRTMLETIAPMDKDDGRSFDYVAGYNKAIANTLQAMSCLTDDTNRENGRD